MPLAEAARVQGDVHLKLSAGVVSVLSGPGLLVQTAIESAKVIGSIQGVTNLDVTYHFVLVDFVSVPTWVAVKRGNTFERAVLRIFGRKTEKQVLEYAGQRSVAPANVQKVAGTTIEIWIYGREVCLMTETGTLLASR